MVGQGCIRDRHPVRLDLIESRHGQCVRRGHTVGLDLVVTADGCRIRDRGSMHLDRVGRAVRASDESCLVRLDLLVDRGDVCRLRRRADGL